MNLEMVTGDLKTMNSVVYILSHLVNQQHVLLLCLVSTWVVSGDWRLIYVSKYVCVNVEVRGQCRVSCSVPFTLYSEPGAY